MIISLSPFEWFYTNPYFTKDFSPKKYKFSWAGGGNGILIYIYIYIYRITDGGPEVLETKSEKQRYTGLLNQIIAEGPVSILLSEQSNGIPVSPTGLPVDCQVPWCEHGKDDGQAFDIKGRPKVKIKEEDQPRAGIGVLKLKH